MRQGFEVDFFCFGLFASCLDCWQVLKDVLGFGVTEQPGSAVQTGSMQA
jgi:hypothetical protein